MNREMLKHNYFKTLREDKQKKYSKGYEAHHIAVLTDRFMDHEENCIMLKGDRADLIENQDYINWLKKKINECDLRENDDIYEIKMILKPVKQSLMDFSRDREKEEIINKIIEGR